MNDRIKHIKNEFDAGLQEATTTAILEKIRVCFLGRNGSIAQLMDTFKTMSIEEKRVYGPLLTQLKEYCQKALSQVEKRLEEQQAKNKAQQLQYFDVTAYCHAPERGSLHVLTGLIEQLENIFISMGYTITDDVELETDYFNFEALNIPADHPARDAHDTFWVDIPGLLLRTHTSPVQIHALHKQKPPLALFAPGRVYRNEATDASHEFAFMQAEGLFVGTDVSVGNLVATMRTFLHAIFQDDSLVVRVRPGYFPFVEPGLEIDVSCIFCQNGCSVCKHTGWIELLGSGLVHPHVLRTAGIDSERYSGFAFGFGLDRLAMLKYGINDVRLFKSNKLAFLEQF